MKKKEMAKLLVPGVVVGFVLGMILSSLVGVNEKEEFANFIGGAMCCGVPTFLNCLIVLKGTAKNLERKLKASEAIKISIPYIIGALVFGFVFVAVIISSLLGINTCTISVLITSIYQATLGVIVSTFMAYLASKNYQAKVKYTRKNKKNA